MPLRKGPTYFESKQVTCDRCGRATTDPKGWYVHWARRKQNRVVICPGCLQRAFPEPDPQALLDLGEP